MAKRKKRTKISKTTVITVSVILAVILVGVLLLMQFDIIGGRNSSNKPTGSNSETLTAFDIEYTFEKVKDSEAVLKFGDVNISAAEYEFFYRQSYSTIQNNAQLSFKDYLSNKLGEAYDQNQDYIDEYLEEFLLATPNTFNFILGIDEQEGFAKDSETGEEITWNEYIRKDAISSMKKHRVKFELCMEMGYELTDDVRAQVYDHIEGLRKAVTDGGYSTLDQYLKILFGQSCDEEFFKNELIREYVASKYDSEISDKLMAEFETEEIKTVYENNYADYDFVDLYVYETSAGEAIAQSIADKATDLSAFSTAIVEYAGEGQGYKDMPAVPKYYVDSTYSTELSQWAYSRERKSGDVNVVKTQNGYCIAYLLTPVYSKGECVTYREIVFNTADSSNGRVYTEDEIEPIMQEAEDIYKQWKKGDKTKDTFAYYALTNSQGSTATAGGLNKGAVLQDITDEELKSWLSDDRKAGDHAIVQSEQAIRIVYFENGYDEYWDYSVRLSKASEQSESELNKANTSTYKEQYSSDNLIGYEEKYIESISQIYLGK